MNTSRFHRPLHRFWPALLVSILIAGTAVAADLNQGLVAYYPLDGDADDASGNARHGLIEGGALFTPDRFGTAGAALALDGDDDRVSIPGTENLHLSSGLTLATWVKYSLTDGVKLIMGKHLNSDQAGFYLGSFDGHLHFYVHSSAAYTVTDSLFNDNEWHLAVGTYDADLDLLSLYVDGELLDSCSQPYSNFNTQLLTLGSTGDSAEYFTGSIDDTRFYERPLSAAEVLALYSPWQEVAAEFGVADDSQSGGVTWTDIDGDGLPDLYISNWEQTNKLLLNDGGAGFLDISGTPITDSSASRGGTWGDYDNDGLPDLYLPGYGDINRLFHNEGGGVFTDRTAEAQLADIGDGAMATWGDYDQDGWLDLYLANTNSYGNQEPSHLFRNLGDNTFEDVTNTVLPAGDYYSFCASWADFNNDGNLDLFITNAQTAAQCHLFANQGDGSFSDATASPLAVTGSVLGVSWCDFDNDGWLDLFIARAAGGACYLFHNDHGIGGFFTDVAEGTILADTGENYSGQWADYDNDGWADLHLTEKFGISKLFHNDGAMGFSDAALPILATGQRATANAWADLEGDGDLDLYVARDLTNANRLYKNNLANGNHWLQIDLLGTYSNRLGVGARISITTGDLTQIREVTTGSGFFAQNSLTVEFGLGEATIIDAAHVIWPSGIIQPLTGLSVDTRITIEEVVEPAVAAFSASAIEGPAPLEVIFTNNSTGDQVDYYWDFGDGNSSTETNPTHIFTNGGQFTVTLTATGPVNVDMASTVITVLLERPQITAILDIPEDEGLWVYVDFLRSSLDTDTLRTEIYTVQRLDEGSWITVNSSGAYGELNYRVAAPTREDSLETAYRVIAHMDEGNWASDIREGFSVDDIAPDPPTGFHVHHGGDNNMLEYDPSGANDFLYFMIHRGEDENFIPDEDNLLTTTTDLSFNDLDGDFQHHYKILAVDDAGNASDATSPEIITAVITQAPAAVHLEQNTPNPFNPTTTICFALPKATQVRLAIYNASGRRLSTLVDEQREMGRYSVVWNGCDDQGTQQGSGVYFYRLETDREKLTRKMLLLK